MKYCFGIDIGGTSVKIGLFDETGNLHEKWEIPTRVDTAEDKIFPDIANAVNSKISEKNIDKSDIIGLGIGVPSPVCDNGFVRQSANLGIKNVNVAERMNELTGFKIKVGNDANVAALGEMWKGSGKGTKNLVMVTLGTGVGGGIVIDGNIFAGTNGATGEIGHMCVNPTETDTCGCGKHGCLEQYSSATGIVRLAKHELQNNDTETVLNIDTVTAKDVFDAVKNGDAAAVKTAEKFGMYLGLALANTAVLADPEIFVLGGGVSNAGEILIEYIKKYYDKYSFFANKNVKFSISKLGNDAGIYGSAKLILG